MKKLNESDDTIAAIIKIPKKLSLQLSRIIIDKAEIGQKVTKPELVIKYIEKGLEQDGRN
jgi:hypothetical protein